MGTKESMTAEMERARAAGVKGLIVTLDWTFSHGRDWGSPWIPDRLDLKAMVKLAPQALARPGWLLDFVRSGRLPDLAVPNVVPAGQTPPTFFGAYGTWMQTPPPPGKTSNGCGNGGTARS
nr:hypothetical protein GCM10020093_020930 [Planobispora longispora]